MSIELWCWEVVWFSMLTEIENLGLWENMEGASSFHFDSDANGIRHKKVG